ncbi:MAG TPA: hypothetical protein VKV03_02525 [Candidatus Binataceae bacterium]|nr:hypothetical protein [Candidatus Binataceae bacterium]
MVLGGDYRALTVVRSLGRHGIPVWVLPEQQRIASKSRYALREIPLPRGDENAQVDFLLAIAEQSGLEGWTLLPTEDPHAAMLARHRSRLEAKFRLIISPWDIVEIAYDKRVTYRVAERLGVACPVTHYPKTRHQLDGLECTFPVILKPAIKEGINRLTRQKAWRIDDRASLLAHYDAACELIDADLIMVQELIPGGGEAQFSYGALCIDGHPLASIVARRSRQYPVDFGRSSSFVETVSAPEVEDIARRMLQSIHYTGLIEAEFKYDRRDNRYKLLDLNPRVWGWHTLAMAEALDFPYFVWRLAQQLEVPNIRVSPGHRWVRMSTDVMAAAREIINGDLSAASYLRSLRSPLQHAIFATDDLMPFLLEIPMVSVAKLFERLSELRGHPRAPSKPMNGALTDRTADPAGLKQLPVTSQAERALPTGGH